MTVGAVGSNSCSVIRLNRQEREPCRVGARPFQTVNYFVEWEILGNMRWVTRKRLAGVAFAIMVIAAVLTIIDTPLGWWKRFGGNVDNGGSVTTNQFIQPLLNPTQKATPAPVPSLDEMLKAAQSVKKYSERNRALRIVAETAVKKGNYEVAIKAGAASPNYDARSKTLTFVALCAAKEGLFKLAVEAADKIPTTSVHDSTKIEVLRIKSEQENSESIQTSGTPVSPNCR